MSRRLIAVALAALTSVQAAAQPAADAQSTIAEARKMLGVAPLVLKVLPDQLVAPVWEQIGALEVNPNTSLPGKTKELIGLAVASQIPCRYCAYLHTQFAKLNGATEAEVREAIAASSLTRHWATISDVLSDPMQQTPPVSPEVQAVYNDIEKTLGSVPPFIRRYPQAAIAPAWKQFVAPGMLSQRDRSLIGAAVAAQIPSVDCFKWYAAAAKKAGATDEQVNEAVAMAALTRAGSTILNGALVDEAAFRANTDQIVKHVKAEMKKQMARR